MHINSDSSIRSDCPVTSPPQPKRQKIQESAGEAIIEMSSALSSITIDEVGVTLPQACSEESEARGSPRYQSFWSEDEATLNAVLGNRLNTRDDSVARPFVAVIRSPEDLKQDGLYRQVVVEQDSPPLRKKGLLLLPERPVILIIDFQSFPPGRLPELNELYDSPARFGGELLGGHVEIISLISRSSTKVIAGSPGPGPDSIRRVNNAAPPVNFVDVAAEQAEQSSDTWLMSRVPDQEPMTNAACSVKVVDFTGKDWRCALFGSLALNDRGGLYFQQGALFELAEGGDDRIKTVVFKNAPWPDPAFRCQLMDTLCHESFVSNDQLTRLRTDINYYRQPMTEEDLEHIGQSINWQTTLPDSSGASLPRVPCLNKGNFDICLQETVLLEEGVIRPRDVLKDWLKDTAGVRITSALTLDQWLKLHRKLSTLGLQALPVYCDIPDEQPPFFRGPPLLIPERIAEQKASVTVLACTDPMQEQTYGWKKSEALRVFVITPEDDLLKVLQNSCIKSLRRHKFSCKSTALLDALRSGSPVCLMNLHCNPSLMQQLESLLEDKPCLPVFGHCEAFPELKLYVTWPEGKKCKSPVWKPLVALADKFEENYRDSEFIKTVPLDKSELNRLHQKMLKLQPLMKSLTVSAAIPANPPQFTTALFEKIVRQGLLEQQLDNSERLEERHFHKAVNSVLLKEYRANREVYSFLKIVTAQLFLTSAKANGDNGLWVDTDALKGWLEQHPEPDLATVKSHYWSLARFAHPALTIGPGVQRLNQEPDDQQVKEMAGMLVCHAPEILRPGLIRLMELPDEQLSHSVSLLKRCKPRSLDLEKRLCNLLYGLGDELLQTDSLYGFVALLSQALTSGNDGAVRDAVDQILRTGSQSEVGIEVMRLLREPSREDLWECWEQRRLKRFAAKVRQHPVVIVTGETGAGKSHIAKAVVSLLNPDLEPMVITVGPDTGLNELFGQPKLKQSTVNGEEDGFTELDPGPLEKWAKTLSENGKPVVLIVDEANLMMPELWSCLRGIYEDPPCLYFRGEKTPLSPLHRIIMTGNPDHFSGRRMSEMLRQRAPVLYYPPLSQTFICNKVLKPELARLHIACRMQGCPPDTFEQQASAVMALYEQYSTLLPNRTFTPRDLTNAVSCMEEYIRSNYEDEQPAKISQASLNGLAWQVFADTLGQEVTEDERWRQEALKDWFDARFPNDSSLVAAHQGKCNKFYSLWLMDSRKEAEQSQLSGQKKESFDLSNQSVQVLVKALWLDCERASQEKRTGKMHAGRHATVFEGPTGRGKSAVLEKVLDRFYAGDNSNIRIVNAGFSQWDELCAAVTEARERGLVLIVSELNMLSSQQIEGLINAAITGDAQPGFHLFTSTNPVSYTGRHAFSPALKSRFNQLKLVDYSDGDIQKIAGVLFPEQQWGRWVAQLHCRLRKKLSEKKRLLLPTVGDMKRLQKCLLADGGRQSDEAFKERFREQYSIFLQEPGCALEDLETEEMTQLHSRAPQSLPEISRWLNTQAWGLPPIGVRQSTGPGGNFDPATNTLTLAKGSDREMKVQALQQLFRRHWMGCSVPVEPPALYDSLFSAIYLLWQQKYVEKRYTESGISAEEIVPLSPEQQACLLHNANHSIIEKVGFYLDRTPTPLLLERMWLQLVTPEQVVDEPMETEESPSAKSEEPVQKGFPEAKKRKLDGRTRKEPSLFKSEEPVQQVFPEATKRKLDGRTRREPALFILQEVFRSGVTREIRKEICDLKFSAGGNVSLESCPWGKLGFDVVMPELATDPILCPKKSDKVDYGVYRVKLEEQWQRLPGRWLHERIPCLRTEPLIPLEKLEIVKDRYTGSHLIRLKKVCDDVNLPEFIHVHFVIKKGDVPKMAPVPRLPSATGPLPLKQALNKLFLRREDLKKTFEHPPGAFVTHLKKYCSGFSDGVLEGETVSHIDLLMNLIEQRKGSCRHRTWSAYALASYFGLPVKIIRSDCHQWIEYSLDGRRSWHTMELGGSGHENDKTVTQKADFKESAEGMQFTGKERQKMLAWARRVGAEAFAKEMGTTLEAVERWLTSGGAIPLVFPSSGRGRMSKKALAHSRLLRSNKVNKFMTGIRMLIAQKNIKELQLTDLFGLNQLLESFVMQFKRRGKRLSVFINLFECLQGFRAFFIDEEGLHKVMTWQEAVARMLTHFKDEIDEEGTQFRKSMMRGMMRKGDSDKSSSETSGTDSSSEASSGEENVPEIKVLVQFIEACLKEENWIDPSMRDINDLLVTLKSKFPLDRPFVQTIHRLNHPYYKKLEKVLTAVELDEMAENEESVEKYWQGLTGSSPTLEQRLKCTDTGKEYSWQPEGSINLDRLVKPQAPFLVTQAREKVRPVKLVVKKSLGSMVGDYLLEGDSYTTMPGFHDILNSGESMKAFRGRYFEKIESLCQAHLERDVDTPEENREDDCHKLRKTKNALMDWANIPKHQAYIENLGFERLAELDQLYEAKVRINKINKAVMASLEQAFVAYLVRVMDTASGNLVLYIPDREEEKAGSRVARTEEELLHWLTSKRDVHPVDREAFEEYLGDVDSLVLDTNNLAPIYREFISNFNKATLTKRCADGLGIDDITLS